MAIFTFTNTAVFLVTLYLVRRVYWESTTGARHRAFAKKHGCRPLTQRVNTVFPTWLPILGIDVVMNEWRVGKSHTTVKSWARSMTQAGAHTISVNIFGDPLFMTDDPENVKTILATDFDKWSLGEGRINEMSEYLGMGVFTNEGKAWKHSREMLRPCFEKSAVADVSLLEKHVQQLIKLLPTDGSEVDLQPLLHELTLDIATEFLFGQSTNSLDRSTENAEVKGFIEALEYCVNPLANDNVKKYGLLGLLLPNRKRKTCVKVIQNWTDKIISEEIASNATRKAEEKATRYIFLDSLLTATQDRTVIRSELLNILLAGRDTTAALLSNVLWELPRHPEMLARLRAEITQVIGDTDVPTYAQLKELKYLRAIINESQRLYPIVPGNSRQALIDTTLPHSSDPRSPAFIPKGAYLVFYTYTMHRDPAVFGADADVFRPERWLEPGFRPGWAYIPFSGGPRVCIGQNFALTEAMFVVVRLVQGFEIAQVDFGEWREKMTLTCTGEACRAGLTRREV